MMSLMLLFLTLSVSTASLITTFKIKDEIFSGLQCNLIEVKEDDIDCARVCVHTRCTGFDHRTRDLQCCVHNGSKTQNKTSSTNMLIWEKLVQKRGQEPSEGQDYLFVVHSSCLYVYHVADQSWRLAVNTGAHVYGLVYIPTLRTLFVTKYGEIHRSNVDKPKKGEPPHVVFKKYIIVSDSSIHGLAVDMSVHYLFTLGMCKGRTTYGVIRVHLDTSPLQQTCAVSIAQGDSYFEDQIVTDTARKKVIYMSSFEKKLRECDYDGKKQRVLLKWTFTKVLDILYNQAADEYVYSDKEGIHTKLHGTKEFSKVDIKQRPRCITHLGNNTVVVDQAAGVILNSSGQEMNTLGRHKSMLACLAIHVRI